MTIITNPPLKRGFAALSPERLAEIAREGGRAAHRKGTAHEYTSETARAAGKKGGTQNAANRAAKKGGAK